MRCFEPGNFILFRGDLVLRKSSPHVFGEGGRRVAPSPIKVVLRCKRMLSALQITQNRKDPIITARAIHILVRSPEISPKYHQARKKFPWDQASRKKNSFPASLVLGSRKKFLFRLAWLAEKKIASLVLSSNPELTLLVRGAKKTRASPPLRGGEFFCNPTIIFFATLRV